MWLALNLALFLPFSQLTKCLKVWATICFLQLHCSAMSQDYCGEFGSTNTMCMYPEGTKGCFSLASGTSKATIDDILMAHNLLRQRLANGEEPPMPMAANMNELVWDPELARLAQRWADQCNSSNDANRLSFGFPSGVGQNVEFTKSMTVDGLADFIENASNTWYEEVRFFKQNKLDPFELSKSSSRFSQLAWADTYAIGCGFNEFTHGNEVLKLYVCNYGPVGNIEGPSMYKTGVPCSACESNVCSTDYPGLCVKHKQPPSTLA